MKMTFNCYISENDENFLMSRHFLLVYNNQLLEMSWMTGGGVRATYPIWFNIPPPKTLELSLEMPWMIGWGQHIPAGLSYPPPKTLKQ